MKNVKRTLMAIVIIGASQLTVSCDILGESEEIIPANELNIHDTEHLMMCCGNEEDDPERPIGN